MFRPGKADPERSTRYPIYGHLTEAHRGPGRSLLSNHHGTHKARRSGGDYEAAVDPVLEEPVEPGGAQTERRVGRVCEQGKPCQRRKRAQPSPESR